MPLYELRQGGRVRERVRTVPRRFEDTRLGLMAADTKPGADGWHLVDEAATAPAPDEGQAAEKPTKRRG